MRSATVSINISVILSIASLSLPLVSFSSLSSIFYLTLSKRLSGSKCKLEWESERKSCEIISWVFYA